MSFDRGKQTTIREVVFATLFSSFSQAAALILNLDDRQMSFSATPLGQGRRFDHSDFLRKNNPNNPANHHHPSAPKIINSPPRSPEKFKDTSVNIATAFTQAVLTQNTTADMNQHPGNSSWASTSSRANQQLPRSTSVEYEQQAATTTRRLNAPPSRSRVAGASGSRALAKTQSATGIVPDSEGEEAEEPTHTAPSFQRGVSPLNALRDAAADISGRFSYFVRQRSREPEDLSVNAADRSGSVANGSYDYANEENEFQAQLQAQSQSQHAPPPAAKSAKQAHKRSAISVDNKAYKPSVSDLELSDEEFSEKRRKRRKKKGTDGRVTSLPKVDYGTSRRKGGRGKTGGGAQDEDSESDDSEELQDDTNQSAQRSSLPPNSRRPLNTSLDDVEQGLPDIQEEDETMEQPSPSFESTTSPELLSPPPIAQHQRHSTTPQPPRRAKRFSPGAYIGTLFHHVATTVTLFFFLIGQGIGFIIRKVLIAPLSSLSHSPAAPFLRYLVLGLALLGAWYSLSSPALRQHIPFLGGSRPPTFVPPTAAPADLAELSARLQALETAVGSLTEQNKQLSGDMATRVSAHDSLQVKLGKLSDGLKDAVDNLGTHQTDIGTLDSRYTSLETRLSQTHSKSGSHDVMIGAHDARFDSFDSKLGGFSSSIQQVQRDVSGFSAQLADLKSQVSSRDAGAVPSSGQGVRDDALNDRVRELAESLEQIRSQVHGLAGNRGSEEDRERIRALEERIGTVEGGVREALELGKQQHSQAGSKPWWAKMSGSSGKSLTVKTTDGRDVSDILAGLVHEQIVGQYGRDLLNKADYALHSAGGQVVPALTSDTIEVHPSSVFKSMLGFVLGSGRAVGLPPVTALHHELRNGRCWPFAGSQGQLGIVLAAPVHIDEVVVEHIPSDVAYDSRSAPREMEVWGLVEGVDNLQRLQEWKDARAAARENSGEEDEAYPTTLPSNVPYVRVARFMYDAKAPNAVQAFAVDPEVAGLGIDFGVVVFMVRSNWGREEYTCLYRVRVHGQPLVQ
ncbi:hypothetical protein HGRIS_003917 [Hohenbuehelia grisea]|uniref:SUN domain-containing protein n=1 Tax=Hohenbuehelia grisea TaxID=104357 RepID=A0ABR3JH02_9AGAR